MAEGWKQLIEDVRGALGLPARARADANAAEQTIDATPPLADAASETAPASIEAIAPAHEDDFRPADVVVAEAETAPETKVITPRQKLVSYAGLAVTLLAALGFGWYVYFGGPQPPAPDVVATFDGGQITIQQVRDHLALLGPPPVVHVGGEPMAEFSSALSFETYHVTVEHMILDEFTRRWAAQQQLDRDAKLSDAMRHVSESVTLDEWITALHAGEMTSAVRESDIQAYYEANRAAFGDATLSEVRDQIRETLAHQNQAQFFEDYIAKLRDDGTIIRDYELLDVPAPTEADIRQYYEANRLQFAVPQRTLVDRIVVPIAGSGDEADRQARAKAEAALAALNTGKNFAQVAAEYSQEPYSAAGVTIEVGQDDPAVVEQAFALAGAGDLSPIIRAATGYLILRLREQQPARTLSVDEARAQIVATLRAENERAWFEQNADRALFTIRGERYTLGQFYHEYQNLPPEMQAQYAGLDGMRQIADVLIDRLLVLDDAYGRLLDQQNAPLLEEIRAVILRQMMHQEEMDQQPVTVSDQQVRDYYDQHRELFLAPPEARIQTIQIYLGQTTDDIDRAWKRADEAYQKLAPGIGSQPADFDVVAREYDESEQDPTAALGEWVRMDDDILQGLPAHPLHDYLLNLPAGSVSRPFALGNNIYIVKVLERTEPKPLEFEQVKDFIRVELEAQQHEQRDAELAAGLLREANTTIYDQVILQMVEADRATPVAP